MTDERPGVVERAFQIGRSGQAASVAEVSLQLTREGYSNSAQVLAGRAVAGRLSRMIVDARNQRTPPV